jgi:hypothetical protein
VVGRVAIGEAVRGVLDGGIGDCEALFDASRTMSVRQVFSELFASLNRYQETQTRSGRAHCFAVLTRPRLDGVVAVTRPVSRWCELRAQMPGKPPNAIGVGGGGGVHDLDLYPFRV